MYKKASLIFIILFCMCFRGDSQSALKAGLQYSYMQHSKLHGISISNDFVFNIQKHRFFLGLELGYGEGNRNFDPGIPGDYNFEFGDYFPRYQDPPWPSYLYNYPVELTVKTSTTMQISLKAGYLHRKELKKGALELYGGAYFTYVNKSYLADVVYDVLIEWPGYVPDPFEVDLGFPFHIRYLDVGPFLGVAYKFSERKLPFGVNVTWFQGFEKNSWLNAGLFMRINTGKEN